MSNLQIITDHGKQVVSGNRAVKTHAGWGRKEATTLLFISMLLAASFCGKAATKNAESMYGGEWVDNDTFITAAAGIPGKNLTDIEERKKSARRSAILNAQYQVIEGFRKIIKFPPPGYNVTWTEEGKKEREKIYNTVKKGVVMEETYDGEQNCQVVYRVYEKDLKKKVVKALSWSE